MIVAAGTIRSMIEESEFSQDMFSKRASEYPGIDPGLVEKVLRAFQLLEGLVSCGVPFVFKGGTSAMLLSASSRRFSIDVDILVERPDIIEDHLESVVKATGLTRYERQDRAARTRLEKDHYKFFYNSVISGNSEQPVLLDVVYQDNLYPELQEIALVPPFGVGSQPILKVRTPTIDALIGDKLSAFAPNTTGIPYTRGNRDMSLEIIKQLYDIGTLFAQASSLGVIRQSFRSVADREAQYRELNISHEEIALDIIDTALTISSDGVLGRGKTKELQDGIKKLKSYVFSEVYTPTSATTHAARAAYLATAVLNNDESGIMRFDNPQSVRDMTISNHAYSKLNKLKKRNPEAMYYWYHVIGSEVLRHAPVSLAGRRQSRGRFRR